MTATMTSTVGIRMEIGCDFDICASVAFPLHKQLTEGRYDLCSVMPIPASVDGWRGEHRTARKRADRCSRRGYTFSKVRRHERVDEVYAINTSAAVRQGMPMSAGYHARPSETPLPKYPCSRHRVTQYGVEDGAGVLVAYLVAHRAGELVLVSQILGHHDHLEAEVMYLLWQGMVAAESVDPDGFIVYNRHDSGTDGLRFFKERVGLTETEVRWLP